MSNLVLIILVLLLLGVFGGAPAWGYHSYGWYPSGGIGLLLLIIVILALARRL